MCSNSEIAPGPNDWTQKAAWLEISVFPLFPCPSLFHDFIDQSKSIRKMSVERSEIVCMSLNRQRNIAPLAIFKCAGAIGCLPAALTLPESVKPGTYLISNPTQPFDLVEVDVCGVLEDGI